MCCTACTDVDTWPVRVPPRLAFSNWGTSRSFPRSTISVAMPADASDDDATVPPTRELKRRISDPYRDSNDPEALLACVCDNHFDIDCKFARRHWREGGRQATSGAHWGGAGRELIGAGIWGVWDPDPATWVQFRPVAPSFRQLRPHSGDLPPIGLSRPLPPSPPPAFIDPMQGTPPQCSCFVLRSVCSC